MKNLYLFFISLLIILSSFVSCKNRNQTPVIDEDLTDSQTDVYAAITKPAAEPHKIEEDLSGKIIVINEKEFIERITEVDNPKGFQYKGQTPCIVLFYANWCRPCTFVSNNLLEMAPEYKGKVIFYKLDIEKAPNLSKAFSVASIPKILYFKPFKEVTSTVGYLNKEQLKNKIDQLLQNH